MISDLGNETVEKLIFREDLMTTPPRKLPEGGRQTTIERRDNALFSGQVCDLRRRGGSGENLQLEPHYFALMWMRSCIWIQNHLRSTLQTQKMSKGERILEEGGGGGGRVEKHEMRISAERGGIESGGGVSVCRSVDWNLRWREIEARGEERGVGG